MRPPLSRPPAPALLSLGARFGSQRARRPTAELDARAEELEQRAQRLEELQAESFREQRRSALATQEAGVTTLGRMQDQTRRATEQLSAVMAQGMSNILVTAPGPIQQLARDADKAFAPAVNAARGAPPNLLCCLCFARRCVVCRARRY